MKPVLMFIIRSCPYCREALSWMEDLKNENVKYSDINISIIDENAHPDIAGRYDYYYVPAYYVDGHKVHEGAATRNTVRSVFENAIL